MFKENNILATMASDHRLFLLDLPEDIIETIVSYLPYDVCSETRAVCKLFNKLCQQRLNKGFARMEKLHAQIQKEVKNKLPRRESERQNHQLDGHDTILSSIRLTLSILRITYMKYTDSGLCCFIPGKVLDELQVILYKLQSSDQPLSPHVFLQEFRDISSMAMEHFDEKIKPGLKKKLQYPFSKACSSSTSFPFKSSPVQGQSMRSEVSNLGSEVRVQGTSIQQVRKDVKIGFKNNKKRVTEQEKKIIQQGQVIAELEKKVSDLNQKFIDMSAELQKLKEVKEGSDSSKNISHLHKEEYVAREDNSKQRLNTESKERMTRSKGLKRKTGGQYESRVKRSK